MTLRKNPGQVPLPRAERETDEPVQALAAHGRGAEGDPPNLDSSPDDVDTAEVQFEPEQPMPEPSVDFEPAPGVVMGHYEFIRELPGGGMGRVFVARDMTLGRRVAIKLLRGMNESARQRFFNEARVTARCTHENIVVIHEIDHHKGVPFIVLEFLSGRPLDEVILQGGLGVWHTVDLFIKVCRGLEHAHEAGIVHRDLKPGNIFEQRSGGVKVLDFGIARFFDSAWTRRDTDNLANLALRSLQPQTSSGAVVGTKSYMAPEQWTRGPVDGRVDLWAVGLTLLEAITGKQPLKRMSELELLSIAHSMDDAIPGLAALLERVPEPLRPILERCLQKDCDRRYPTARELREALEEARPSPVIVVSGAADMCPFPGLLAFREEDAQHFYGREQDILTAQARLRQLPLMAVVGPSGVGKSSFVQAGLIPAVKASGDSWESIRLRPGRRPITAIARLIATLEGGAVDQLESLLRQEPHLAGRLLRKRATHSQTSLILYVDQFEELYTQGADSVERELFSRILLSVADDACSPLRVVLSIRSDLLDRAAESPALADAMLKGALLLSPPTRHGLRDALVKPLAGVGYRFEFDELVEEMLDEAGNDHAVLPLLQFSAALLWEQRDVSQKFIPRRAYQDLGGIAGALAKHASAAFDSLGVGLRRLARQLLVRLVTGEGTRAVTELDEASALGPTEEMGRVIDHLVGVRLLLLYPREVDDVLVLELAHEALIDGWPRLSRWVEESRDELRMAEQLKVVARQWDARGRPEGLLWRADAAEDALRWWTRNPILAGTLDRDFMNATARLAARSARRRKIAVVVVMAILALVAIGSALAQIRIRRAERRAQRQAQVAKERARKIQQQLTEIQRAEGARQQADHKARVAKRQVHAGRVKLKTTNNALMMTYEQLAKAYGRIKGLHSKAERARQQAVKDADAARTASEREKRSAAEARRVGEALKKALAKEQTRVKQLKLKLLRKKMINDLSK